MSITLRPYQESAIAGLRASMAKSRSSLLVSPTGSGKTVMFSYMASRAASRGLKVGVFAHRVELLDQISRTLTAFDVRHSMIAAGAVYVPGQSVYVCSAQTYARRIDRMPRFDLVVIDEAHHATPGSVWNTCLEASPDAKIVGVTATPERLDGRGLGETFEDMVLGPTPRELIALGALSRYRLLRPSTVDLSSVHTLAGDFNRGEVAEVMDTPTITGDAVSHYTKYLDGKPSVAFCTSIEHAAHVAEHFRARGYQSASVDGKMSMAERTERMNDFRAGRVNVLTSADLISEGLDIPGIFGAILLRPTQSLGLYIQQVGRALRTFAGKDMAIILDHVGNSTRHGLPDSEREWSLDGVARRKRDKDDAIPIRQCERCASSFDAGERCCPYCGWTPAPNMRRIEEVDGELAEVEIDAERERYAEQQRRKMEQGRAKSLDDLIAMGMSSSRANHILVARAEKESLRAEVMSLARTLGDRISRGDVLAMKPKQLRSVIAEMKDRMDNREVV